jgi:hypothetical protein
MTDLTLAKPITAPPPYDEEKALIHEEKSPLHLTSPVSPTSSSDEYEKVACQHDVRLSPKCRAIRIGITVINPAAGLAMALCPHSRRRTCRTCGAVVVVPRKRAFC